MVKTDLLVVSRGGGPKNEHFNSSWLAESALELNSFFCYRYRAQRRCSLLQRSRTKHFITPTAWDNISTCTRIDGRVAGFEGEIDRGCERAAKTNLRRAIAESA